VPSASQKLNVVHQSTYRHNYAVAHPIYLENIADTARGGYIALLEAKCRAQPAEVLSAIGNLSMKIREMGANAYFLSYHDKQDSLFILRFRAYFIYVKPYDANENNKIRNKLFFFSSNANPDKFVSYYLDDSIHFFESSGYVSEELRPGTKHIIKPCNVSGVRLVGGQIPPAMNGVGLSFSGPLKIRVKSGGVANFIILYRKELLDVEAVRKKQESEASQCGGGELDYRDGRVLMQLFEAGKLIK
jgi:hypothetical protein